MSSFAAASAHSGAEAARLENARDQLGGGALRARLGDAVHVAGGEARHRRDREAADDARLLRRHRREELARQVPRELPWASSKTMPSRFSFGCEPNATSTAANDFDAVAAARRVAASWVTPTMRTSRRDVLELAEVVVHGVLDRHVDLEGRVLLDARLRRAASRQLKVPSSRFETWSSQRHLVRRVGELAPRYVRDSSRRSSSPCVEARPTRRWAIRTRRRSGCRPCRRRRRRRCPAPPAAATSGQPEPGPTMRAAHRDAGRVRAELHRRLDHLHLARHLRRHHRRLMRAAKPTPPLAAPSSCRRRRRR